MAVPNKTRRKTAVYQAKRPPLELALRVALVLLVAMLGYHGVTRSLAHVVAKANPGLAHRLAPENGRITAAYSAALSGPQATPQDRVRADGLARLALQHDPTVVAAIATLGINAQIRNNTNDARRFFAYAQKLSRRDTRTQLWSIEDAVVRNNIPDALRWYDAALRTNRRLDELLFPILASASEDPVIRKELIRTLSADPLWGETFIRYVAGNGPDPRSTATLFQGLRRAEVAVPDDAMVGLIDALIRKRRHREAWSVYETMRQRVDRLRSRNPAFTMELEQPSQFDWAPVNNADVSTSIRDKSFYFLAQPGSGGPLLSQKQLLDQGRYRLTSRIIELDPATGASPYWTLTCEDGRELGRAALSGAGGQNATVSTIFDVPSTCPVQTLTLVAPPSEAVAGIQGRVARAELVPLR